MICKAHLIVFKNVRQQKTYTCPVFLIDLFEHILDITYYSVLNFPLDSDTSWHPKLIEIEKGF